MRSATFVRASGRYWLSAFPAVARELRRRRQLAIEIPDPVLRRVALEALERKRCNLEGAAAVELLAGRHSSRALVRTLTACQTMCDYLDLLSEQPVQDPVANGYRLHAALIAALTPGGGEQGDYYFYGPHREDGGYLETLVRDVREGLACLPRRALVDRALICAAERIADYQSFNHGDHRGSHEPFRRWARAQAEPGCDMSWWETAAAIGSTLLIFALISSAASPRLTAENVADIEAAYFPWIGALHTLLDSLVDIDEDHVTGGHRLIECYRSPMQAAERMSAIAREALARAEALPGGTRHRLLVIAMTGFYLREACEHQSAYSRAVAPRLLSTVGGLGHIVMRMMSIRHAVCRSLSEPAPTGCLDRCDSALILPPASALEPLGSDVGDVSAAAELQACASADCACGE